MSTVTPVAGFRADIIKASILAVSAAILLGGTAYVLNRQIGAQAPPPSPFIDIYTDRGGVGLTKPSQSYRLNETVRLFANVSNGTSPAGSQSVAFTVYDPNGAIAFLASSTSDPTSGIATATFRIATIQSTGTWRIIATVKFEDQVLIDALTFECTT